MSIATVNSRAQQPCWAWKPPFHTTPADFSRTLRYFLLVFPNVPWETLLVWLSPQSSTPTTESNRISVFTTADCKEKLLWPKLTVELIYTHTHSGLEERLMGPTCPLKNKSSNFQTTMAYDLSPVIVFWWVILVAAMNPSVEWVPNLIRKQFVGLRQTCHYCLDSW